MATLKDDVDKLNKITECVFEKFSNKTLERSDFDEMNGVVSKISQRISELELSYMELQENINKFCSSYGH
jgi:SMC interacting uncharacterized protein involved in chromosome segregation